MVWLLVLCVLNVRKWFVIDCLNMIFVFRDKNWKKWLIWNIYFGVVKI